MVSRVDYAALGKQRIIKPGETKKRFLVYGRNKKGKTRFASTAPNVLFLDPEAGTEELDPDTTDVWPIYKWEDVDEAVKFLRSGKHEYEWVCVDGLTKLSNMGLRFVMKQAEERDLDRIPGMVQQRDYGKSGELMKGMINSCHSLNMGVVFTAQERMEVTGEFDSEDADVENPESRFVPDLPKGVRNHVNSVVSGIGRIYTVRIPHPKIEDKMLTQRRLWIAQSDSLDTGFRSKHPLPDFIKNPTVPKLVELIVNGKVS